MGNAISRLREGRVRASSSALNWRGLRFSMLVLLLGCGGNAAPGSSANAGGAGAPSSGGTAEGGSSALPNGGAAQGNAPALSEGGARDAGSGGAALGGAAENGSGGLLQGGAGAASQPTLEPVRVVRGDPMEKGWWDLSVRGVALDEYEGKVATVRLGMPDRPPERLGSGQARVEAGAFELFFPEVWESSLYKSKLVYIDVDGNGSCDPVNDRLFANFRADLTPELTVRGSGAPERADFYPSADPSYCALFNSDWPSQ